MVIPAVLPNGDPVVFLTPLVLTPVISVTLPMVFPYGL